MKQYPLIKFVILFIGGILLQNVFKFDIGPIYYFLIILTLLAVMIFLLKKISFRVLILNIILSVSVISAGSLSLALSRMNIVEYPFEKLKNSNTLVYGKIIDIKLKREGQIIFTTSVDSVHFGGKNEIAEVDVLCRIYEENELRLNKLYDKLEIGNSVLLKGTLQKARDKRNPGEFDYYKYLQGEDIAAIINIYRTSDVRILLDDIGLTKNLFFKIRKSIDRRIQELHTKETAALLRGLLLADRGEIEYDIRESFVNAGVVHVLAVSGLHVGFVIIIFLFLFGRFNIYLRYIFTIVGLITFVIITGSPPSVFRASVMAITMIIAFLTNRSYNSVNSLALAALFLLILNPNELFNPGFQLSFSAVLSIVLIYPFFRDRIITLNLKSNIIRYALLFVCVSMAAQVGTLPFTLIYFHKLSIAALFANLIVIPMIGFIVGIGIFTLAVSTIWTWLALIYASANNFIIEILYTIVNVVGTQKSSHIYINQFSLIDSLLFYICISFFIFFWKKFEHGWAKAVLALMIVFNLSVYLSLDNKYLMPKGKLSMMAIDIGQGDAILVKFPNEETALIDAGDATEYFDNGERVILPLLKTLGIDKINYGLISHVDSDHYKGFLSLFRNGIIEKVFKPSIDSTLQKDIELEMLMSDQRIPFNYYHKNNIEIGNCRIYVLNDTANARYKSFDSNDKSGILKVVYGKTSFLFVGDAGVQAEKLLLNTYGNFLDCDVLKVGHHGSKYSSSFGFIKSVAPNFGLISAGIQNKFKHPTTMILERLNSFSTKVDRTDLEGAVLYESNGENIKVINWKDIDF